MNLNIQIIEKCTYEVIFNLLNQIFNLKSTLQFENRSFELTVNQKCNNSVNCLIHFRSTQLTAPLQETFYDELNSLSILTIHPDQSQPSVDSGIL